MAAKRQATSDLNHENWDREEKPEDAGTFLTASEDELKSRVIKKAKRKLASGAGNDTADAGSAPKSVFSGFSGFGKPTTPSATASSSPFSFLSKIAVTSTSAATTTSSSGFVSSSTTTTSATPTFSFGGSTASTSIGKTTDIAKPSSTFSFGNTTPSTTISEAAKTVATTLKDSSTTSSEYYKKLSSLNQAVSEWIKTHVDKNPVCILTPIFKDYEKYLQELEDEKKKDDKKERMETTSAALDKPALSTAPSGLGTFNFTSTTPSSATTSAPTSTTIETAPKANGFSFGFKKTEDSTGPTTTSTFSFGLKATNSETSTSTATTTPSSGFFSSSTVKPFSFTPGATPFSFGNIQPPISSSSTNSGAAAENEDEDEEPPKNDFKQVVEDDAVYSKKCKVFVKKDGNFVDKGVGTLYLKPVESSGKTQLLVRADTNLGNILVNLILSSAIPTQRMGKNNVMMVCLPTPDAEKPTSMLLRVKTGEEADELLTNIDKYKK